MITKVYIPFKFWNSVWDFCIWCDFINRNSLSIVTEQ